MINPSQTIIVTGGASGIGEAIVRLIIGKGGKVGIIDVNEDAGETLVKELGDHATFSPADVCNETQMKVACTSIEKSLSTITGLVTCAGVSPVRFPIEEYSLEEFRRLLDNHASGTFLSCKVVGSKMATGGGGSIVTISSATAVRPAPMLGYAAGKAAVLNLTQSLAVHWGTKNVRINTLVPGWVDTPFIRRQEAAGRDLSPITKITPMRRLVRPEEVGEVALFLLSNAASAMTGSAVVVDCGITLAGGWLPYGDLP